MTARTNEAQLFPTGKMKKTVSTRNRTWDSSHREQSTYHCATSSDVKQRERLPVIYLPHQRWTRLGWMRSNSWRVLKIFFLIRNKKLKQVFLGHSNFKFVDFFLNFYKNTIFRLILFVLYSFLFYDSLNIWTYLSQIRRE
jgi:hypothetical protein